MLIAKVIGTTVSTIKEPTLEGRLNYQGTHPGRQEVIDPAPN